MSAAKRWVVVCGYLASGLEVAGPFSDEDEAEERASDHRGDTGEPAEVIEVRPCRSLPDGETWEAGGFVLLVGHLDNGLRVVGPFPSKRAAISHQIASGDETPSCAFRVGDP